MRVYIDRSIESKDFNLFIKGVEEREYEYMSGLFEEALNFTHNNVSKGIGISNVTFQNCGNLASGDKVCASDILKFMLNQKKGVHTDEFYCNNGRKIFTGINPDNVKFVCDGETTQHILKEASLFKIEHTKCGRITTGKKFLNDGTGILKITVSTDEGVISSKTYDSNLDLIYSTSEGVTTSYTRNSKGLGIFEW